MYTRKEKKNQGFENDFKQAQNKQFPVNQNHNTHSDAFHSGDEADDSDSLN